MNSFEVSVWRDKPNDKESAHLLNCLVYRYKISLHILFYFNSNFIEIFLQT